MRWILSAPRQCPASEAKATVQLSERFGPYWCARGFGAGKCTFRVSKASRISSFKKKKLAVFIDGCFWHGCTKCYRRPKSRQEYWDWKVKRNRKRDLLVNKALKNSGFRFIRIWEHDAQTSPHRVLARILNLLAD